MDEKYPDLTSEEVDIFKKEFMDVITRLGLTDFEYDFFVDDAIEKQRYGAFVRYRYQDGENTGRRIQLHIYKNFRKNEGLETWDIEEKLKSLARHEALEVLLHELNIIAESRTFSEDSLTAANHRVINRLLWAFFKDENGEGG